MEINKQYKDRLFKLVFGDESNKENILSLYNALTGKDYRNPEDITLTTIDDFMYIDVKNDVSFILDDSMVLWEQQSSYNPNMPLRGFIYCGRLYQRLTANNDFSVYGTKLIRIPTPQYVVFYNGMTNRPAIEQMHLSDAFMHGPISGYEWTATVINLNASDNKALMHKCSALEEYSEVCCRIRTAWIPGMTKDDIVKAVDDVVSGCIRDGLLSNILSKHRSEVINVLFTEFTELDRLKLENTIRVTSLEEGAARKVFEWVQKGKFTPAEGAEDLHLSINDFLEKMKAAGFSVPK